MILVPPRPHFSLFSLYVLTKKKKAWNCAWHMVWWIRFKGGFLFTSSMGGVQGPLLSCINMSCAHKQGHPLELSLCLWTPFVFPYFHVLWRDIARIFKTGMGLTLPFIHMFTVSARDIHSTISSLLYSYIALNTAHNELWRTIWTRINLSFPNFVRSSSIQIYQHFCIVWPIQKLLRRPRNKLRRIRIIHPSYWGWKDRTPQDTWRISWIF